MKQSSNSRWLTIGTTVLWLLLFHVSPTTPAAPVSDLATMAHLINQLHIQHPPLAEIPTDSIQHLKAFLERLDPYSSYLNPQEFAHQAHGANAEQMGIGGLVTRTQEDGLILVPFQNGPAYQAGIHYPVKLISVEGQNASELDVVSIAALIKTRARLQVNARNLITGQPIQAKISIGAFQIPPVEIIEINGQKIVRLHVFPGNRALFLLSQYLKQIAIFDKPLIIDLRYAIGGNLFEALDSVSLILPQRLPIATTQSSDGLSVTFRSRDDLRVAPKPVYLLIGPNTASAAEVFARALHHYGYAVLVGKPSFGKCLTQQFTELPAKDGLKLTVGRILDPAGQYCAGQGIAPDIAHTGNIHDTTTLLRLIDQHNQTHRLVCQAKTYHDQEALEQGITKLGWNQKGSKYPPISLVTSKGTWQLCLGPPMSILSAQSLQTTEANRLNEKLLLVSLFPVLSPIEE